MRITFINGDDIGVIESGGGAGLPQKTLPRGLVQGPISGQDFDRDVTAQTGIVGEIHFSHSAGAKDADNFIRTEL
jgi:hypothetical protein